MLTHRYVFKRGSVLKVLISGKLDQRAKRASKKFIKWMKYQHAWPRSLSIYIFDKLQIKALDGDLVFGTFYSPDDPNEISYIRVAGKIRFGADAKMNCDALCDHLATIAHEIGHYLKWIEGTDLSDQEEEDAVSLFAHEKVESFLYDHRKFIKSLLFEPF